MIELLRQGLLSGLQAADTPTALALLQEHRALFLDPIEGAILHAKTVYYAIKQGNKAVLQFLLNLPVVSDVSFFQFCGQTPLSMAIENNQYELISPLLSKTDKDFALHMAVTLHMEKTKSFLLNKCHFRARLLNFLGITA